MLENKCAIVTGASRGIGKAIAKKLASLGANIVLNYRSNEEEALKVQKELLDMGVEVLLYKCDTSDSKAVEQMIKETKEKFKTIDIMVNNAWINRDSLILRMKDEDFDSVIDVNLKGVFNCLRAVTPVMVRQRSGKIVNLSSVVGIMGNAGQVNYAASKAGVIGMTKSLAKEIGSRGITVNAVAPGFISTDMTGFLTEEFKEDIRKKLPLKRLGKPEDVANVVAFLASDEASYITGQVINVDGGMVM